MTPHSPPDVAADVAAVEDMRDGLRRTVEHIRRYWPSDVDEIEARQADADLLDRVVKHLLAQDAAVREAVAADRERCIRHIDVPLLASGEEFADDLRALPIDGGTDARPD